MVFHFIKEYKYLALTTPLLLGITAIGYCYPESLQYLTENFIHKILESLSWFIVLSVNIFLVISLYLAFSKYGSIRLGDDSSKPEFSKVSWVTMLFAAGMGVGLLFWGPAEPIAHFANPPIKMQSAPDIARQAIAITNYHWALHAWGVYAIAGLVIAYFGYRKKQAPLPGTPILQAFRGPWVKTTAILANILGILAVAFGLAGSLAMGVFQVRAGLHINLGTPAHSSQLAIGILGFITVLFLISATTGLQKGIKWLSNINFFLCLALVLFIIIVGPSAFLMNTFITAIGDYISNLIMLSLQLFPFRDMSEWKQNWTLIWFIWWIAWAPFVGVFIARISRGRTIREYIIYVLAMPTLFTILWFSVFGGLAFHEQFYGFGGIIELVHEDVTLALFSLLDRLPLTFILSTVSVFLIIIFLVTSADSATFVLGMLTSEGKTNPSNTRKIIWGTLLGLLTSAIMLTDSINMIKAFVILGSIPYTLIILMQCSALLKTIHKQEKIEKGDS